MGWEGGGDVKFYYNNLFPGTELVNMRQKAGYVGPWVYA